MKKHLKYRFVLFLFGVVLTSCNGGAKYMKVDLVNDQIELLDKEYVIQNFLIAESGPDTILYIEPKENVSKICFNKNKDFTKFYQDSIQLNDTTEHSFFIQVNTRNVKTGRLKYFAKYFKSKSLNNIQFTIKSSQ
ncbi:MAG: hypothetical protein IT221_04130 [Fluviicola sp.]|nr:hypothetical protein [Fluviicola sp.]